MITTLLAFAVLAGGQEPQAKLHPAFVKTPEQMEKVWSLAEKESKKQSNLESRMKKTRKTIGTYRVSVIASEGSSFVYYLPPESTVYFEAFNAKREYAPFEKISKLKQELIPPTPQTYGSVYFYTTITLMPMFGGGYGSISRYADPNDLKDVKVVLKVGDRILQPVGGHPGNLIENEGKGSSSYTLPRYNYSTTTSSASGSAYGSGGYAYGSARGTSTTVTTYHEYREEGYNWYHGDFFVEFKIIDKDGKPLITDKDKEIQLIVVYSDKERTATYKLSDLVNPYR